MMSIHSSRPVWWLSSTLVLALAVAAGAEVRRPAPPSEYDVALRFQIRAPLPGWYDRFDEMLAELKRAGFVREPLPAGEPEDPSNDRLSGVVASSNARKLLAQRYVQTILLRPHGLKLKPDDRVKIRLELATGLTPERQQRLNRQVAERLAPLGFRETAGYDHRGFTELLGTIDVARLDQLISDLRTLPAGWLVPRDPISTLPMPLRDRVPVKVVEVLPEPTDIPPAQEPAPIPTFSEEQAHLAKLSPDLRALATREGDDRKILRVEVVLARAVAEDDSSWRRMLMATASSVVIEGSFGNVVTVLVRGPQAGELARPASVVHVRLPRSGEPVRRPAAGPVVDALAETRLGEFHERGFRGKGVKLVVVDGDFSGHERLLGNRLPRGTRLIDFTIARNASLLPDPMPGDDGGLGGGTIAALAAHRAAPQAELVLVRVDPATPHHLLILARFLNEPGLVPPVLAARYEELLRDRTGLDLSRVRLNDERRRALAEQVFDEGDPTVPEQRKKYVESQERIKRAEQALKELEKQEAELQRRNQRFLDFRSSLAYLRGARVVICPLTWDAGYPLDGASPLSRYFDETPFVGDPGEPVPTRIAALRGPRGTVWVQSAGDTRGQTWVGLFRDSDGNRAMEFAPSTAPLRPDRWTPELNFLAWQSFDGKSVLDLPEKARVRVTMQWREPHDPALEHSLDDPYRIATANFALSVLKQRDPTGLKLGADEMELIARSYGAPVRLQLARATGTYEIATEFEASAGGRFALRVEGALPASTRPAGDATAETAVAVEIRPRIFVEVIDPASRGKGRVVFADYAGGDAWPQADPAQPGTPFGGVGMPADARNVLTIGAANKDGHAQHYTSVGGGPGRALLVKPDLLGFDHIDLGDGAAAGGSWVATAFDGGLVACLIGSSTPANALQLFRLLHIPAGAVLRVPASWEK